MASAVSWIAIDYNRQIDVQLIDYRKDATMRKNLIQVQLVQNLT